MAWNEILAIVYIIIFCIILWFITIRKIVIQFRKNISNTIPKDITNQTNNNECDNKPEPCCMSSIEITNLNN